MFVKKLSLLLFLVFVLGRVFASDTYLQDICLGRGHCVRIFNLDLICCRNQSVTPGIETSEQWTKCAVAPADEDETYSAAMWRIYNCMLKMVVPKDQEKISLIEFGKAMTAKYSETLETEINEKLKDKVGSSTGVDFKDIENIDQLRVTYFDIEKEICGIDEFDDFLQGKNTTGIGCSLREEALHRGGDCYNNKSLPIYDRKYNRLYPQNCNNTLIKFKENLETINSTFVNSFLYEVISFTVCPEIIAFYQCEDKNLNKASCHLIQKGIASVDDLISFKLNDDIPTEKIVDEFMPKYISEKAQKKIQNYLKTNFSTEAAKVGVSVMELLFNASLSSTPLSMINSTLSPLH